MIGHGYGGDGGVGPTRLSYLRRVRAARGTNAGDTVAATKEGAASPAAGGGAATVGGEDGLTRGL